MLSVGTGLRTRVAATVATAALGSAVLLPATQAAAVPQVRTASVATVGATAKSGEYKYHFSYNVIRTTESAQTAFRKMNKIMNGVFPVPGMPKTVKKNQRICLKMVKKCNPVRVTAVGKTSFTLLSLPGHLEGAGKYITFSLKKNGYKLVLDVQAHGPKAVWQKYPLTTKSNRLFAKGMWAAYAVNLAKAAEYNLI